MLDIERDKRKTLKKEKEKRKMRKSQTTTKHIFLFLLLYIEKFIIFCWKTYLEKLLYYYICITAFFTWRVVGDAVMKHQRPYRYALAL